MYSITAANATFSIDTKGSFLAKTHALISVQASNSGGMILR
jgi:hypothetical protein